MGYMRKCPYCGMEFEAMRINKIYCTRTCKANASRERKRERDRQIPSPEDFNRIGIDKGGRARYLNLARAAVNLDPPHRDDCIVPHGYRKPDYFAPHHASDDAIYQAPRRPRKPKKPRKILRSPEENHAIIDERTRKARELGLSYGEYTAYLQQGIDPATHANLAKKSQSYEERAWLEHIYGITGKI